MYYTDVSAGKGGVGDPLSAPISETIISHPAWAVPRADDLIQVMIAARTLI